MNFHSQSGRCIQGINSLFWLKPVAGFSPHRNGNTANSCCGNTLLNIHTPGFLISEMKNQNFPHFGIFQRSMRHHIRCPFSGFFTRLKEKTHIAGQSAAVFPERFRQTQIHRCNGVMAAGMHFPRINRSERTSRLFLYGKSVYFASDSHGFPLGIYLNIGNHSGFARPAAGNSPFLQMFQQKTAGFLFLHAQLRVAVQPMAEFSKFPVIFLTRSHRFPLSVHAVSGANILQQFSQWGFVLAVHTSLP